MALFFFSHGEGGWFPTNLWMDILKKTWGDGLQMERICTFRENSV